MKQFFVRRDFHNLAKIHHRHPVTHVAHNREIMGYEKIGQPELFLEFFEEIQNLGLDGYVKGGDRLICHDQFRSKNQGAGNAHPLPLAATEFMRVPGELFFCYSHQAYQVIDEIIRTPGPLDAMYNKRLENGVAGPSSGVQGGIGILKDHLHLPTIVF